MTIIRRLRGRRWRSGARPPDRRGGRGAGPGRQEGAWGRAGTASHPRSVRAHVSDEMLMQGRDYVMQDGGVVYFRFNV